METATRMPGTGVLIASGVIVVAAAVIGVLVLRDRPLAEYEPGSPEAAAQAYVQAILDRDLDLAHRYLSPELAAGCEPHELRAGYDGDAVLADFTDVRVDGDRATIDVRLTARHLEPDPFALDEHIDSRLVLEQVDGEWRIVVADWPFYECTVR